MKTIVTKNIASKRTKPQPNIELFEIICAVLEEYKGILADRNKVLQIIKDELSAIKEKFGDKTILSKLSELS